MNIKLLILFLLLGSSFTGGALLYNTQEEKPAEKQVEKPVDPFVTQPSFEPPATVFSGEKEPETEHHELSQTTPDEPENNVSPGVGQNIIQMACKTANAVSGVSPDGQQYTCEPPQVTSNEPPQELSNEPPQVASNEPALATPVHSPQDTSQAASLHEAGTEDFPAPGSYEDGLNIDGWPVNCGDIPIDVVETLYESTDPNGRGRYDGYKMSTLRTKIRGDTTTRKVVLSSSALKGKRTVNKLYRFYEACGVVQYPSDKDRSCWIAEKGKKDGWLTQDGVQFLCRETSTITCEPLKNCFSGPPPKQDYTQAVSTNPLAGQYTGSFPPEGLYPPGSLSIDGIPVRCGNTPIRILSQPGTNWLGVTVLDENVIKLNRASLVNQNTAGKLNVFADECAHMTYQASNYEAGCGSWAIRKQNGWANDQDVESYCRDARENFYSKDYYLENTSPEDACQRVRGCYAGSIQPIQGSVWGR